MIFDTSISDHNPLLQPRSDYNFYLYYDQNTQFDYDNTIREYTDNEIKLLFAIDPYGVADYVCRYANELAYHTSGNNGLAASLAYKDRIFRLLFNRNPKYFARALDDLSWYVTTDISNLSTVLSESESIFGMHPIWDKYTFNQLIDAAVAIVDISLSLFLAVPKVRIFLNAHKTINTITKIASFTVSAVSSGFISASADEFVEEAFERTSLMWAYNFVSFYTSIYDIINNFDFETNYYPQIFEYCVNETGYDIYFELNNGNICKLKDIKDAIS